MTTTCTYMFAAAVTRRLPNGAFDHGREVGSGIVSHYHHRIGLCSHQLELEAVEMTAVATSG